MIILINFLPFFSFVVLNLFGRFIGRFSALFFSFISLFISFLISCYYFIKVLDGSIFEIVLFNWINNGNLIIDFSFVIDSLSITFCLLISFITTLILIYSFDYLNGDPYHVKFFSYLNFFAFSMLTMVLAKNYVVMFLGWEGVGLASFLLVNFWDTRNLANKSALKAVIFNRIGDIFFFAFLSLIFFYYNSFDFSVIFPLVRYQDNTLICIFILIAAMAKSAQIFLHPWLPDAMEGPTPVSALLHSATMVTAGLFLILRSYSIFLTCPTILIIVALIGLSTSLISSFTGLFQYDIKRIIAFSTCSQLGFILFSIGLGNLKFGLFHLFNHAFFKALLFLCAGSVIHATKEQDIRKMGGLFKFLPLTYCTMLIASLSLCGFPFLSGYYSKDLVLQAGYSVASEYAISITLIIALSSFLSSFYSFRLIYFVFLAPINQQQQNIDSISEGSFLLYFPLIVLCVFSIISGFIFKDIFFLSAFFQNSLFTSLDQISDVEFISDYIKLLPTFSSLLGIAVVAFIYSNNLKIFKIRTIQNHLVKKLFFDQLYYNIIYKPMMRFHLNFSYKILDKGLFERVGPDGLYYSISFSDLKILNQNNIIKGLNFILNSIMFLLLFYFLQDITLIIILILSYDKYN